MSEYLEFYAKHNTDENMFIPLGTFCRSNLTFQSFRDFVPSYAVVEPLNKEVLGTVRQEVEDTIKRYKKYIKEEKKEIKSVEGKYSLSEFIEYKNERKSCINEIKEDIKSLRYVEYFTSFLEDIDAEIWCGIECELPEGAKV